MIGTIGLGGGSKDEEMAFEALEAVVAATAAGTDAAREVMANAWPPQTI
jgi:hypothetical protein